jgi:hypothetical protein
MRCQGTTYFGFQCRKSALPGSDYCHNHKKENEVTFVSVPPKYIIDTPSDFERVKKANKILQGIAPVIPAAEEEEKKEQRGKSEWADYQCALQALEPFFPGKFLKKNQSGSFYLAYQKRKKQTICQYVIKVNDIAEFPYEYMCAKIASDLSFGPEIIKYTTCGGKQFMLMPKLSGPSFLYTYPYAAIDVENCLNLYYNLLNSEVKQMNVDPENFVMNIGEDGIVQWFLTDYTVAEVALPDDLYWSMQNEFISFIHNCLIASNFWINDPNIESRIQAFTSLVVGMQNFFKLYFSTMPDCSYPHHLFDAEFFSEFTEEMMKPLVEANPQFAKWWNFFKKQCNK